MCVQLPHLCFNFILLMVRILVRVNVHRSIFFIQVNDMFLWSLLADARKAEAKLVLYGHTHRPDCHQEEDGLWVMNPGHCGTYGGSAGIVKIVNNEISACYLITQADLDDF